MKNIQTVVKATQKGRTPLYYSPSTDTVYTEAGEGRFYLTDLLQPHTPDQVEETVNFFMSL
jgi:hypothetical protein